MRAGGRIEQPGGQAERSSVHAAVARRAVAQLVAAKASGDGRLAAIYAAAATRAIEAHLAELKGKRRLLP